MIDTAFFVLSGAAIFVVLYLRYLNGQTVIGTPKSHVSASYWGRYEGTEHSTKHTIVVPKGVPHRCTSCQTNTECPHPFL